MKLDDNRVSFVSDISLNIYTIPTNVIIMALNINIEFISVPYFIPLIVYSFVNPTNDNTENMKLTHKNFIKTMKVDCF